MTYLSGNNPKLLLMDEVQEEIDRHWPRHVTASLALLDRLRDLSEYASLMMTTTTTHRACFTDAAGDLWHMVIRKDPTTGVVTKTKRRVGHPLDTGSGRPYTSTPATRGPSRDPEA